MTATPDTSTAESDRRLLADAPPNSDHWDDATWAAWFRSAARAHGERFDGDTKATNPRTLLGGILHSALSAVALAKEGEVGEASEHVDAIERLTAAYRMSTVEWEKEAIHLHFSLSYANYLVLPRTLLQSMPDAWQARFVALVDELHEAFQHVPQAESYEVTAGTVHEVSDLDDTQLKQLGIVKDWYRGEEPPEGLDAQALREWEAEHEDPEGPTYSKDGEELDPDFRVLLPCADPVPHYNRGRARVEPRLGGAS